MPRYNGELVCEVEVEENIYIKAELLHESSTKCVLAVTRDWRGEHCK